MTQHSIYKITHKTTGKSYIGQTIDIERRWKEHSKIKNLISPNNNNKSWSSYINNAIIKHGKEAFDFEIIVDCDAESVDDLEIYYIDKYNTLSPNGYNLIKGGASQGGHHQESREKMSKSHTGKIVTEITKARMSKARMGELNPNYGKISSNVIPVAKYSLNGDFIEEFASLKIAAQAISENCHASGINAAANKGNAVAYNFQWRKKKEGEQYPLTIDAANIHQNLVRRSIKGTCPSGATREFSSIKEAADYIGCAPPNISACLSGKSWKIKDWVGWTYTSPKQVYKFIATKDGVDVVFDGYKEAELKTGATHSAIKQCIAGIRKSAKGYTWKEYTTEATK